MLLASQFTCYDWTLNLDPRCHKASLSLPASWQDEMIDWTEPKPAPETQLAPPREDKPLPASRGCNCTSLLTHRTTSN